MKTPANISPAELDAYRQYAKQHHPDKRLVGVQIDGDHAVLEYEPIPFQRIRRITGYLAPVKSWNGAKRAELADRVTHGGGKQ